MASPYQKKQKKKPRKTKPKTPEPKTRSRTPAADDPSFWGRRGWPSAALNGKDEPAQTPVSEREEKSLAVEEEGLTLRKALKEMFRSNHTHDEFSVKSIVISVALASAMLAGAYYFAKMIVDIMNKN